MVDKTLKETLTKQNIKLSFRTTRIHDLLTFRLWITRQLQRFMHEQIKKEDGNKLHTRWQSLSQPTMWRIIYYLQIYLI
jgi:hypothetical protein